MLLPIEIFAMSRRVSKSATMSHKGCLPDGGCSCGGEDTLILETDQGTHHHHEHDGDGEIYMSIQALKSMYLNSMILLDHLDPNSSLPDWVESKLARASSDLRDVHDYLMLNEP